MSSLSLPTTVRPAVVLTAVMFLHAAFLAGLWWSSETPIPPQVATLSVRLLPAAATPDPMPTPVTPPPKPMPPAPKRPQPVPRVVTPTSVPAPPLEVPAESPAESQSAEPETVSSLVAPAAVAESSSAEPAPIVAPRFDVAYLNNPAPIYPAASRRASEAGRVLLRVRVAAGGNAEAVTLHRSSGFARLDQAAMEAVQRWRFIPARQGELAVAEWVIVPIHFSLTR